MECRACMDTSGRGFTEMSYAVDADGNTLFDYFNECTQLQAKSTDNLPKSLCTNCTKDLRISYNLRQRSRQSDIELKRLYILQEVKLESRHSPNELLENEQECSTDPLADVGYTGKEVFVRTDICEPETDLDMSVKRAKTENLIETLSVGKYDVQIVNESSGESMNDNEGKRNQQFKGRKSFCCEICESVCATKKELKKHIFEDHKSEVICMKCPKVYDLPRDLQTHEKLVHSTESPLQCPCCKNRKIVSRGHILKHFKAKHKTTYLKYFPRIRAFHNLQAYECNDCNQDFDSVLELAAHIKNHTFGCPICSMSFTRRGTYRAHVKRIHNSSADCMKPILGGIVEMKKSFKCSSCAAVFSFERSLQVHMLNEHNQGDSKNEKDYPYECKICNLRFKRRINYRKHNNQKHPVEMNNATAATLNCSSSPNHSGNDAECSEEEDFSKRKQTYICSYCPAQLSSIRSLQSHEMRAHSTDKSKHKECPICQKKFYPSYLKNHMKTVHATERKCVCDICGNSFKNYSQLCVHKVLHNKRDFPCTMCEKTFISKCVLIIHMRSHTGEMPYACHLCDRRFKIKGSLNYHLQRHAGIKRKCQECGKEFNHVSQLKVHMYKHKGMPFRCSICDYGTPRRTYFKAHLQRMHNMTMSADELNAMFKEHTGRNPYVKRAEDLELENENVLEEEELS